MGGTETEISRLASRYRRESASTIQNEWIRTVWMDYCNWNVASEPIMAYSFILAMDESVT